MYVFFVYIFYKYNNLSLNVFWIQLWTACKIYPIQYGNRKIQYFIARYTQIWSQKNIPQILKRNNKNNKFFFIIHDNVHNIKWIMKTLLRHLKFVVVLCTYFFFVNLNNRLYFDISLLGSIFIFSMSLFTARTALK